MTTLTEGRHAAEFVLSEAMGNRSRDNATIVATQTILAGSVLGRITANGNYGTLVPGGTGGGEIGSGIALYPITTGATVDKVSIIARDAEVNGKLLVWPAGITGPQQTTAIADLAKLGIIVR